MNSEKVKKRIEKSNSGKLVDNGLNVIGSLSTGNPFFIATSFGRGIYSYFNDDETNRSVKTVDMKELSKVQNTSFNILFFGMLTDYVITLLVLMYPDAISTYLTDLFNSDIAKSAIEGLSQGEDWK